MGAQDELVAVYDAAGDVAGSAPRWRMRRDGLWHAATSILVRSGDGRSIYVHRRTDHKDVNPGAHDCFAGGVVAAGETPDSGAERELAEELGIRGVPLEFLFRSVFEQDSVRHHGFVYETRWDGPVVHQPEEVADGWWMPVAELRERLADHDWPFAADSRRFIREWFTRQDAEGS
ncbi:NUDIX hydrolase [Saccharopolyspora gloriosae]|uniref:NUDIX hydrolase n=1 Tax=Saccharopolyspora gloriosae TaxID=455344 RepID=UPI001FB6CB1F|nr:NUDIX domain-containing protein [Saccharopolyspora gloriosae]